MRSYLCLGTLYSFTANCVMCDYSTQNKITSPHLFLNAVRKKVEKKKEKRICVISGTFQSDELKFKSSIELKVRS